MKYFIGIIFLFFISCSSNYQITEDEKLVDAITAITAKKLQAGKNLILIGTGGSMMDEVKMLAMSFQFFKEIEIEEARNLTVSAVKEYLAEINNNQKIRPYLSNYPFEPKNVEILIWVRKPDGSAPKSGNLDFIAAVDGLIKYYTTEQDSIHVKRIYSETYEEALSRLNDQKSYIRI